MKSFSKSCALVALVLTALFAVGCSVASDGKFSAQVDDVVPWSSDSRPAAAVGK